MQKGRETENGVEACGFSLILLFPGAEYLKVKKMKILLTGLHRDEGLQLLPLAGVFQLHAQSDHLHGLQSGVQAGLQEAALRAQQFREL